MAKKESIVEKIEDAAEEVVEELEEAGKKAVKEIKKALGTDDKPAKKKTAVKKTTKKEVDDKKKALLEKAKKLEEKFKEDKGDIKHLKSKVKGEEEKKDTLVPIEDYLKASLHLGTRVITPDMREFVYRRRADGLAVFNTSLQDDKIREAAEYLAKYDPDQIVIACKREAGWKAASLFAELFGIKVFTKKYPAGTLTNTNLEDFFEKDLIFICDPWLDKNILVDAGKTRIPVFGICDTNNFTKGIDFILPGNNKSYKSLGMIFYLLAKQYAEIKKLDVEIPEIDEFVEGWANLVPPQ